MRGRETVEGHDSDKAEMARGRVSEDRDEVAVGERGKVTEMERGSGGKDIKNEKGRDGGRNRGETD